jgi:uncharacterized membrane protein YraQ (UPF0718 family)
MNLFIELYEILYLVTVQFRMIFPYWSIGVLVGSFVSVFLSERINNLLLIVNGQKFCFIKIVFAALLGAASPVCMYGTIPIIASLGSGSNSSGSGSNCLGSGSNSLWKGNAPLKRDYIPQHLLAAFMVSSILINPNLFVLSFALGAPIAFIRLFTCVTAGVVAGIIVRLYFKEKTLFDFSGFATMKKCLYKTHSLKIFLSDFNRGITKTAPYFLFGILLTALFEKYVSGEWNLTMLRNSNGLGVVLAASFGVPIYVCGGGTIPLLKECLRDGMTIGSAIAFMISGPATKITNLSAVKTILGVKNFTLYIVYNLSFAVIIGFLVDKIYELLIVLHQLNGHRQ